MKNTPQGKVCKPSGAATAGPKVRYEEEEEMAGLDGSDNQELNSKTIQSEKILRGIMQDLGNVQEKVV